MGVLQVLADATPNRGTVVMCLDGSTQAEVEAIEMSFQTALDDDKIHGSLADPAPSYNAAIRRREELRDKVLASQVTFVFERVPWTVRVALQAEHPPRPGSLADMARGYNFETFLPALIRASVVEVIDAKGDKATHIPDAVWDGLLGTPEVPATDATGTEPARKKRAAVAGSLNHAQVSKLVDKATAVNEQGTAVPPSALSLLVSQDSGESSAPHSPGTRVPAGGKAGSPARRPTSATGRKQTPKKASATKPTSDASPSS